jgi:hypothetical protein
MCMSSYEVVSQAPPASGRVAVDADASVVLTLRMLRATRDELLLDRDRPRVVLDVLSVDKRMSALRARLEAFLADVQAAIPPARGEQRTWSRPRTRR